MTERIEFGAPRLDPLSLEKIDESRKALGQIALEAVESICGCVQRPL